MPSIPIIPCEETDGWRQAVDVYAAELKAAAYSIGTHGMTPEQFDETGLFASAVERLRGSRAASMGAKRAFSAAVFDAMVERGLVTSWSATGSRDRHDYEVKMPDGRMVCIEAKGCLDGNNTNIFERPPNADEFVVWSLCQNAGADPRHNAWSGIHTRLSSEIIARRQRIDGLIIWDMLCGTPGRLCPKLEGRPELAVALGTLLVPPPCMYLFPRTIPDARNNPAPAPWRLQDVHFLNALTGTFGTVPRSVVRVHIEARMHGPDLQRRTLYVADDTAESLGESRWTTIRRANN